MSPGRIASGRARAVRVTLALIAISACLGAAAYAATRPQGAGPGLAGSKPVRIAPQQQGGNTGPDKGEEVLRTRFLESPPAVSSEAEAQFRFHVPPRGQRPSPASPGSPGEPRTPTRRFKCRLDGGRWMVCSSPYRLTGLALGGHSFDVRALSRAGRAGPASSYAWQIEPTPAQAEVSPKPFSIELLGQLEELYPGHQPQPLPVLVANPNSVAIEVTSLSVAIAEGSQACREENFLLTPSSVSPTAPLVVPPGGSATLPTATISAPTIGMLNLSVNQDPCQGAAVPLVFDGEARG